MEYKFFILLFVFPLLFTYLMHDNWNGLTHLLRVHIIPDGKKYDLVIGVISAWEHSKERQAIRDTWKGYIENNKTLVNSIMIKFVIGSEACNIHPQDREDGYSCTTWKPHQPASEVYELVVEEKSDDNTEAYVLNYGIQRLHFQVLQPVILTKLGVHTGSLQAPVAVRILDAPTEREFVNGKFDPSNNKAQSGFVYTDVQAYMLPKGFEGILVAESMTGGKAELPVTTESVNLTLNTENGYIRITQPPIPDMIHYNDPTKLVFPNLPIVSFIYTIHEAETLVQHISNYSQREEERRIEVQKQNQQLIEEQEEYGDIVMVDTVDVYRNIPRKVSLFHKWAADNLEFSYLMKTDDDCYVDAEKILHDLELLPKQNLWWGRFRHNWAVEHYGKWAELAFPSMGYPSFACGSGNVLSRDIVDWVVSNADRLYMYQGEDVAMGIWLSAINPLYKDDHRWQCEKECLSDMLVMPELHHMDIVRYWNNRQTCGDPCGCS